MMNSLNPVSDAINSLGLNLYHQLSQDNKNKPNNLFLSPYSIFIPLLMALEGANGETAQQMGAVLCLPENVSNAESLDSPWLTENVHPLVAELTRNLINLVTESSENKLAINNQIKELEENLKLIQKQSDDYRHLSYEAEMNYSKQRQIIHEQCYENYNQVKAITDPKIKQQQAEIEQHLKEIGKQAQELYNIRLQELQKQPNAQTLEYYRSYQEQLWQEEQSTAEQLNLLYKQGIPVEIAIANSIWQEKKVDFKPTFLETLNQFYGEVVHPVDFTQSEQVRLEINQWIENNTRQKIKDCLKPEDINPTTILVLINAIYFRGNWLHEFNPQNTHDQDFTQLEGTKIKIPFMNMREEKFNYGCFNVEQGEKSKFFQTRLDEEESVPQVQIIELPYRNQQFSMVILLPAAHDQLPFLESQLSYEKLNQWLAQLSLTSCNLLLPKFKIETRFSLKKYLSDLGMPRAFTANAQFQKMYDGEIQIDEVIHQTFLEVDEEGTKAAAVTALISRCFSVPDYEDFYADRPFLFFIRDRNTDLILFLGRFMGC